MKKGSRIHCAPPLCAATGSAPPAQRGPGPAATWVSLLFLTLAACLGAWSVGGPPARAAIPAPTPNACDAEARVRELLGVPLTFRAYVFLGPDFPRCEFEDPARVEGLLGPYSISTTYYNRSYRRVATAGRPGPYGAIIEIVPRQGRVLRRYATLFWKAVREGIDPAPAGTAP